METQIISIVFGTNQGAGKRPGSEKKEEKKPNREKSEGACQCLAYICFS